MPDYPDSILDEALMALHEHEDDLTTSPQDQERASVAAILDAVAPLLADQVALKILEHAEAHSPRQPGSLPTGWDIHFAVAGRIAAGAFRTEAEMKQQAAEALAAGNYVACDLDDAGRPRNATP